MEKYEKSICLGAAAAVAAVIGWQCQRITWKVALGAIAAGATFPAACKCDTTERKWVILSSAAAVGTLFMGLGGRHVFNRAFALKDAVLAKDFWVSISHLRNLAFTAAVVIPTGVGLVRLAHDVYRKESKPEDLVEAICENRIRDAKDWIAAKAATQRDLAAVGPDKPNIDGTEQARRLVAKGLYFGLWTALSIMTLHDHPYLSAVGVAIGAGERIYFKGEWKGAAKSASDAGIFNPMSWGLTAMSLEESIWGQRDLVYRADHFSRRGLRAQAGFVANELILQGLYDALAYVGRSSEHPDMTFPWGIFLQMRNMVHTLIDTGQAAMA